MFFRVHNDKEKEINLLLRSLSGSQHNNGKIRNNIIINEQEDPELYCAVLKDYDKIKQQVRDAKLENLSSLVNRGKLSDNINYSRLP